MTQEQAENKITSDKPLEYFIRGVREYQDGFFMTDACACYNRQDAEKEVKRFTKYILYRLEKDPNQNL